MAKIRATTRLLYTLLAVSLSACGPAPTADPGPSASPTASPSTSTPSPTPSASITMAALTVHLQADASLAGFATAQTGPFTLCLGQITQAETSLNINGTPQSSGRKPISLADLLKGIDLDFGSVPVGTIEGRTTFFNATGQELGFVSWQTQLTGEGGKVNVLLKGNSETKAGEACPRLEATVTGGTILGAGGQVVSTTPLPNPVTTPTPGPTPTPSPAANAPTVPAGLKVVEQTSSSLTLQWEFGAEPVSYRLFLDGKQVASDHTSPNYYRFTGLNISTQYTLGVTAVASGGASSPMASVSSTTLSEGHIGSGNFSGGGSSSGQSHTETETLVYIPDGAEFQVNSSAGGQQSQTQIASDPDGNFIVVWTDNAGLDGDNDGVFGQRYDSDGDVIGSEFQVNTYTTDIQAHPAVAMHEDGSFVVVWESRSDGDTDGVFAQRYDSDGDRIGSEFQVNTATSEEQIQPDIAMDEDGNFVVVWADYVQDGGFYGVYGQRYTSDGGRIGSEFQVNTYTTSDQEEPSVAMSAEGRFVVTWTSENGQDGSGNGVYGQLYDSNGNRAGVEFLVNTYTSNNQDFSSVAMDDKGGFVVVWESDGPDGSSNGIFAQHFKKDGARIGSEFNVNTYTGQDQAEPEVAMDGDGNYVVVWNSYQQDTDNYGIYGQRYTAGGVSDGSEFQVNVYKSGNQEGSAVAMDADGNFTVVWTDYSSHDGDGGGIFGLRYTGVPAPDHPVTFADVAPVFAQRCSGCHGFVSTYSGIRARNVNVRNRVFVLQDMPRLGSDEAAAMTNDERELIADWIDQGMQNP